jgi:hypothetical protein
MAILYTLIKHWLTLVPPKLKKRKIDGKLLSAVGSKYFPQKVFKTPQLWKSHLSIEDREVSAVDCGVL